MLEIPEERQVNSLVLLWIYQWSSRRTRWINFPKMGGKLYPPAGMKVAASSGVGTLSPLSRKDLFGKTGGILFSVQDFEVRPLGWRIGFCQDGENL